MKKHGMWNEAERTTGDHCIWPQLDSET